MKLLLPILLLIVGFILLIKGADFFVAGSSSVAKRLKVPPIIVGLTIVAMGTSLPECAVSVTASLAGSNSLAVSNITGSNIFNLMVVCGICALFTPLTIQKSTLKKEFPFSILCALLMLACGVLGMTLGHIDGAVFLLIFIAYLLWMIYSAKKSQHSVEPAAEEILLLPAWKCLLFIVGGAAAIKFGGDFVVDNAVIIATAFGMSQTWIGLTIVALGTSLPELVTSIIAARRNELDMALGNVVGSNIFNILFVLGIASAINPIEFLWENIIDIIILVIMSLLVFVMAWTKERLDRKEGIVMLAVYAAYFAYICIR